MNWRKVALVGGGVGAALGLFYLWRRRGQGTSTVDVPRDPSTPSVPAVDVENNAKQLVVKPEDPEAQGLTSMDIKLAIGIDDAEMLSKVSLARLAEIDDLRPMLHRVLSFNAVKVLEALLKQGLDVNVCSTLQTPPLHVVAMCSGPKQRVQLAELLINYGCNVRAVNSQGYTALYFAVLTNDEDFVSLLLEAGVPAEYQLVTPSNPTPVTVNIPQLVSLHPMDKMFSLMKDFDLTGMSNDQLHWSPKTRYRFYRTRDCFPVFKALVLAAHRKQCPWLPPEVWDLICSNFRLRDFDRKALPILVAEVNENNQSLFRTSKCWLETRRS
eukprot:m.271364 g.271364  ORF g.271364 m.271364 type:complete len:326 (+) comp52403_c0_seq1:46-1023(+)